MSIVVVATLVPLSEHRYDVIAAIESTVERVHEEPGCELYALHEGKDRLVFVEKWESAEALGVHSKGPAIQAFNAALAGKLTGPPDVQVLQAHPAGDLAKGIL